MTGQKFGHNRRDKMDMMYVHIGLGFLACLITASWGYRAGRDHGIEIEKRSHENYDKKLTRKFKQMDARIQSLKKFQDRTVTTKK